MTKSENTKPETMPSSAWNARFIAFGICILFPVILITALIYVIRYSDEKSHREALRYSQQSLDAQIADIKTGRSKSVTFYCSSGTDGLLAQLTDFPQIEGIVLNLSDATDEGMKSIAALKKLKYLRLYGSNVSDAGFSCLKNASSLEHLELVNTQITDKSLPLLNNMPNLSFLALSLESRLETAFTESGLENLKHLTKLKKLYLCGGWASEAAIKELQNLLPDCTIRTEDGDLVM
jgi:hypothetical protein